MSSLGLLKLYAEDCDIWYVFRHDYGLHFILQLQLRGFLVSTVAISQGAPSGQPCNIITSGGRKKSCREESAFSIPYLLSAPISDMSRCCWSCIKLKTAAALFCRDKCPFVQTETSLDNFCLRKTYVVVNIQESHYEMVLRLDSKYPMEKYLLCYNDCCHGNKFLYMYIHITKCQYYGLKKITFII